MKAALAIIVAAVAEATGVQNPVGERRTRRVNRARSITYYLAHELTGIPFPGLGEAFGRNPNTVHNGARFTERRLRRDPELRALVADLRRQIEPKLAEIEDG